MAKESKNMKELMDAINARTALASLGLKFLRLHRDLIKEMDKLEHKLQQPDSSELNESRLTIQQLNLQVTTRTMFGHSVM